MRRGGKGMGGPSPEILRASSPLAAVGAAWWPPRPLEAGNSAQCLLGAEETMSGGIDTQPLP